MKKIILFILSFFAIATPYANGVLVEDIFSDIDSNYIYRDELQTLYDRGMILPNESGKFLPDTYLNRDEFVGIAMEVICERCIQPHTEYKFLEEYAQSDVYFDVQRENPYFYCIAEANKQNYVRGYDAGQECQNGTNQFGERPFCPLNRINVEEAVAVLLRNSGIFTIADNQSVISQIQSGTITQTLGGDVSPTDGDGNPYTFYGYIRKALDYEIYEYDTTGNRTTLRLLEQDSNGNINPQDFVTKQEFLRMSYIALKSNSCSDISGSALALKINIFDKQCSASSNQGECELTNFDDPEDTYDFASESETTCELGINANTGYAWRFVNLDTGEQIFRYGEFQDNFILETPGEWRVYLRAEDECGNISEVYSTVTVVEDNPDPSENYIDVDIDVYDDDCSFPGIGCEELEFEDEEDDGDDTFDFDGDVSTSCEIGDIEYDWTFSHVSSGEVFSYDGEYIDDILFGRVGEWLIELDVIDGCGQTASEQMTYFVQDEDPSENYIDVDIDVYDDDCSFPGTSCEELEFEDEEDDGDDTFDFDGDVFTNLPLDSLIYLWTFTHEESGDFQTFTTQYVEDFEFDALGEWTILLEVTDGEGNSGSEQMTYFVYDDTDQSDLAVSIDATPILGYENLEVDFTALVGGGEGPYDYSWDFGDSDTGFGKNIDHIYDTPGVYEVILTVTDNNGDTASASVTIQVLEDTSCENDSDGDGIVDCDDACPLVAGEASNSGCPVLETSCSSTCGCEEGYTCSDSDPLTCGGGVCLPDLEIPTSCLYNPNQGSIFGSAVCATCPCDSYVDFLADMRRCDLIFPAITSPTGSEIYSRGNVWQVQ